VRNFVVDPVSLGLAPAIMDELVGGTPRHNADVVRRLLDGEQGPVRNIVLLNAAAGLVVADAVSSLEEGLERASAAIDSGAARSVLEGLVSESRAALVDCGA
jgi:anthranilate phosphoribosyltransferase